MAVEPLDGARAKLRRARQHIEHLKVSNDAAFKGTDPPTALFTTHIDTSDQTCVLTLTGLPDVPEEYTVVIAEAAYNLRSALNYVVTELAWIDTRGHRKIADQGQGFPLESVRAEWSTVRVQRGALDGLTRRHRAMVESFSRTRIARAWLPAPLPLPPALEQR